MFFYRKWFVRNPFYRFYKVNQLNSYNFSSVIILHTIQGRLTEVFQNSFKQVDLYYYNSENITNYVLADEVLLFEKVTGIALNVNQLKPDLKALLNKRQFSHSNIPDNYIVVSTGATAIARTYPIKNFLIVLEWLAYNNHKLIFLGKGDRDIRYYNALISRSVIVKKQSVNMIGKLSFQNSMSLLSKASLFIGVESSLFNAANFLDIPSVVIYGGGHYGRFKHQNENLVYVSNMMDCFGCNWQNCPHGILKFNSARCISAIEPQKIINALSFLLNKKKIN